MKFRNLLCLILCLSLVLCLPACKGDDPTEDTGTNGGSPDTNTLPQIHTYDYYDSTFLGCTPDKKAQGTNVKCTAMQGMAASERYVYTAKQKDDAYANIFQYDTVTGENILMTYYPTIVASDSAPIDNVAHCNDLDIYDDADGSRYLLAATARTPSSSTSRACLVRFLLDEKNATIRTKGYYNLVTYDQLGFKTYVAAGSVRKVSETDSYHYFLVKDKDDFLWFMIPVNDLGGTTRFNATELTCVRLFTIDNRNALFSNRFGQSYTAENLESWTNQGFGYSFADDLLFVPLYNPSIGSNGSCESVIVTFRMDGMLTPESMEQVTEDRDLIIFPTNLSFHITNPSGKFFELESCVFLLNQGENGDHRLYFNTNGGDVAKSEGVWVTDYEEASVDIQPLVTEHSIVYTVEYNYNVEGTAKSQWLTNAENYHFDMEPTLHIAGIKSNLRINTFIRSGYEFEGWYLHRASDNAWLCSDGNWYTEDVIPEGINKKMYYDAQKVDNLTEVNGDVITAYVQWDKE